MHPDRGWITHLSVDGRSRRVIAKTGRPNGMTLDRDGVLWIAESVNPPSLLRVTLDGKVEQVLTDCNGEPFLFPNDLRFGPDGALYLADGRAGRVFRFAAPPTPVVVSPLDFTTEVWTARGLGTY